MAWTKSFWDAKTPNSLQIEQLVSNVQLGPMEGLPDGGACMMYDIHKPPRLAAE